MSASDFTPDFSKLDFAAVSVHVTGICAEVAKCTPTPLDDAAVTFLAPILTDLLRQRLQPVHGGMMAAGPITEESLGAQFAARGRILNPETLKLLVSVLTTILPLFL